MKAKNIYKLYRNLSLKEYTANLYTRKGYSLNTSISTNLVRAFNCEFKRRRFNFNIKQYNSKDDELSLSLEEIFFNRIVQTTHHQCLTNGPSLLAMDLLSLSGLPKDKFYMVGSYSAIPFSSSSFSGAACFNNLDLSDIFEAKGQLFKQLEKNLNISLQQGATEKKVYFIPGATKNSLVYASPLFDRVSEIFNALQADIAYRLPNPTLYDNYNDWCLDFCQTIQRFVFNKKDIYYFDINRVISDFLCFEFSDLEGAGLFEDELSLKKNGLLKNFSVSLLLLFSTKSLKVLLKLAPDLTLFVQKVGQKFKLIRVQDLLEGELFDKNTLIAKLRQQILCPTSFLIFCILSFENNFRCLGSFLQFFYIKEYAKIYEIVTKNSLGLTKFSPKLDDLRFFGAARFPKEFMGHSFDFFCAKKLLDQDELSQKTMHYFWQDLTHRFL